MNPDIISENIDWTKDYKRMTISTKRYADLIKFYLHSIDAFQQIHFLSLNHNISTEGLVSSVNAGRKYSLRLKNWLIPKWYFKNNQQPVFVM